MTVLKTNDGDFEMVGTSLVEVASGEVVADLQDLDHTTLVKVFLQAQEAEQRFKEWCTIVEDELVRRHGDRRAAQVVGAHEVDVERGWGRDWDVEDLMATVSHLCQEGLLTVADVDGLVTEETVRKVNGRRAQELLSRLQGEALMELSRCFEWRQRGRAKVKITPVVEFEG